MALGSCDNAMTVRTKIAAGKRADARWDWEWMASWGLLRGEFDVDTQINAAVQQMAHTGS